MKTWSYDEAKEFSIGLKEMRSVYKNEEELKEYLKDFRKLLKDLTSLLCATNSLPGAGDALLYIGFNLDRSQSF